MNVINVNITRMQNEEGEKIKLAIKMMASLTRKVCAYDQLLLTSNMMHSILYIALYHLLIKIDSAEYHLVFNVTKINLL